MLSNSALRRNRRANLKARITGATAARDNVPLEANPHATGSTLANMWLLGYAHALTLIFADEEPPRLEL